jgi:methionine-rich copper-binding protein CopC
MNERIRELAHQARQIGEYGNYGQIQLSPAQFELKFAELIVRECAQIAVFKDSGTVATADVAGHMAAGRSIAARLIREHFGVDA